MTRWLRFLITYLKSKIFHGDASTLEGRLTLRTWFTEADVNLVNNASIISYTELGRLDLLLRSGMLSMFTKKGVYYPAAAVYATFLRPIRRFQKLELVTRIAYWDETWIWLEQEIFHKEKLAVRSILKATLRKDRTTVPFRQMLAEANLKIVSPAKPHWVPLYEKLELPSQT